MKLCIENLVFATLGFLGSGLTIDGSNKQNLLAIGNGLVRRADVIAKSERISREPLHNRIVLLEYQFQVQLLMDDLEAAKDQGTVERVAQKLARVEFHLSLLLQNFYSELEDAN